MERTEEQKAQQVHNAQRFTVLMFAIFSMGFTVGLMFGAFVGVGLMWYLAT